jgi:hypothetical protein
MYMKVFLCTRPLENAILRDNLTALIKLSWGSEDIKRAAFIMLFNNEKALSRDFSAEMYVRTAIMYENIHSILCPIL